MKKLFLAIALLAIVFAVTAQPFCQIDISVKRLLKARFELGETESSHPWALPYSVVDCAEHRRLALQIARETMTLLQNKENVLPLDRQAKIAVIGPNANDSVMQWGNYNRTPSHTSTLLSALRAKLPAAQLIYEPVCGLTDDFTYGSSSKTEDLKSLRVQIR